MMALLKWAFVLGAAVLILPFILVFFGLKITALVLCGGYLAYRYLLRR